MPLSGKSRLHQPIAFGVGKGDSPNFIRLEPADFTNELIAQSRIVRYIPVQRAFPSYYAPLSARIALQGGTCPASQKTVWLPTSSHDLLGRELGHAFEEAGFVVRLMDHEELGKQPGTLLPRLLREETPDLFFSPNFKGLDHFGLSYHMLREAGTTVAVWLVDNPFNVLPAVKSRYWHDVRIFVTDHSFIGPLIETGAKWVTHLPLAASPHHFADGGTLPGHGHDLEDKLVFVGRSKFPKMEQFFAGITLPQESLEDFRCHDNTERPDYHWWHKRLGVSPLWPGSQARSVGAGAEMAGVYWKSECLEAAGSIVVFGDSGWHDLAQADVRPVVDYYAHLPAIYRSASVVLNVNGMQLPAGLTQRHFDVWCAGGFLITDTHSGLNIFPEELVEPITFTRPDQIRDLFLRFRKETVRKTELRKAWRDCILRDHTYTNRVQTVLSALNL